MMLIVLSFSLFLQSCNLIRQEIFLIPSKMKSQWVSIEYGNPKCASLGGDEMNPIFNIPENGFLCTSSPRYSSFYQRRYYLVDENGIRTLVPQSEKIWREGTFAKKDPSLDKGQPDCNVVLHGFFMARKRI